ncbi:hypothetical protein FSHL1_002998 [Fusarium sambucinum]
MASNDLHDAISEVPNPDDASTDDEFEEHTQEGGEGDDVDNDAAADTEDDEDDDEDHYYHGPSRAFTPTCGLCRFYFEPDDSQKRDAGLLIGTYKIPHFDNREFGDRLFHKECIWGLHSIKGLEVDYRVSDCIYWFLEPPKSMIVRRERWIRQSIAQDLQVSLMGRPLPQEILEAIAGYCTRGRATQIICGTPPEHSECVQLFRRLLFDCEDPIWVHYVEIEGFRYVRSLSYSRIFPNDTLLLPAGYDATASFNIYFAEDYRGIRQIIATQSDQAPSIHREEGLHWVICCRHQRTPFYLRWKNDFVKLRGLDVTKTKDNRPDWERKRWAAFPLRVDTFPQPPRLPGGYDGALNYYNAIHAVDWNSPGVCGYYFHMREGQIRGIVTLKLQDTPTTHIDEYDQHGHPGIYVPIESDERVSELWIRTGEFFFDFTENQEIQVPILRTSKGREHVLGTDISNAWPANANGGVLKDSTYTNIRRFPEKGPTRMFYSRDERDGNAVAWMAFEEPSPLEVWLGLEQITTGRRQITVSLPAPDSYSYNLPCFYANVLTSAPLDGVTNVRACRAWESQWGKFKWGNEEVVGLLLTYTDGSQRCVGQVRPDSLEDILHVRSNRIWLGATKGARTTQGDSNGWFPGNLKIKCVYVEDPGSRRGYSYLEVPLTGSLKWHFAENGRSSVAHFDSGEADDEIGKALACGTVSIVNN